MLVVWERRLMAIVADGPQGRVCLSATNEMHEVVESKPNRHLEARLEFLARQSVCCNVGTLWA